MHAQFYRTRPAAEAAPAATTEARTTMSAFIRRSHRWVAMLFTLLVAANFAAYGIVGQPPLWLVYAPLPPLFLLMAGGLFMFFQPYRARRRARTQEAQA
jgi:peptidoglycan/LPS O-acetylase OafA/YrhL